MGAHYTSEANILKLIRPLFLDELEAEFETVKRNKRMLFEFQKKLCSLAFLDPACGCGNFLVITYRELRRLELRVLQAREAFGSVTREVFEQTGVNVDQFYGIEVEDFPAQIARVAMWLVDHQMNLEAGQFFGDWIKRIPLDKSAEIRRGNALRIMWADFCPPGRLNYILGNPPFIGKQNQSVSQKEDLEFVTKGIKSAGLLDYVGGWYLKAAQYMSNSQIGEVSRDRKQFADVKFAAAKTSKKLVDTATDDLFISFDKQDAANRAKVRCAFVSTNSISQVEQVGVLWGELLRMGMHIQFAHRTFQRTNDAPGKAAVHCIIVGFGLNNLVRKQIWHYDDIRGVALPVNAVNINAYLVDALDVALPSRRNPIAHVPPIVFGSMPNDGGHLLMNDAEKDQLLALERAAKTWVKPFLGAEEFLNGIPRWCLWLKDCPPAVLDKLPQVKKRVQLVKAHRSASSREATQKLAKTPQLFSEVRQSGGSYILVPRHPSERRDYRPIGYLNGESIAGDSNLIIPNAQLFHFVILCSHMHMAWIRYVCGRLKSDFRYSNTIVYNNFPRPSAVNLLPNRPFPHMNKALEATKIIAEVKAAKLIFRIEAAAQAVLDARAVHQLPGTSATLAQLYDPRLTPANLARAHAALDKAVDAAYLEDGGQSGYANDGERVAFLFKGYAALTSLVWISHCPKHFYSIE